MWAIANELNLNDDFDDRWKSHTSRAARPILISFLVTDHLTNIRIIIERFCLPTKGNANSNNEPFERGFAEQFWTTHKIYIIRQSQRLWRMNFAFRFPSVTLNSIKFSIKAFECFVSMSHNHVTSFSRRNNWWISNRGQPIKVDNRKLNWFKWKICFVGFMEKSIIFY